ncbi:hypothetical protein M8J75_006783 [Diaphorina citri]|nr:hypothetical protein M8J75_006783 [Diaphorina citri]
MDNLKMTIHENPIQVAMVPSRPSGVGSIILTRQNSTVREKYLFLAVATLLVSFVGLLLIVAFSKSSASCGLGLSSLSRVSSQPQHNDNVCLTSACVKTANSLLSGMDETADPCNDFFQYACGTWNRVHQIPEDKSSINTFEVLADQVQSILKSKFICK